MKKNKYSLKFIFIIIILKTAVKIQLVFISVVMTSYNHEKFISESIESVLNQTFSDLELIIVDDFSIDKSREIIKRYKEKDNRIKILFHKENKGLGKSTSDGVSMTNGKFLALIDSDDVWDETKLEKQINVLEKDENLVVWSDGELIDENGRLLGKTFTNFCNSSNRKKSGDLFYELLLGNIINRTSLIVKRSNFGKVDERFKRFDDIQFEVALAKKYNFFFIDEPLTKIRRHRKNISASNKKILDLDALMINNLLLKKYSNSMSKSMRLSKYRNIINFSIKLGKYLTTIPGIYNRFKIDVYSFIYRVKNKLEIDNRLGNILLNDQKLKTYQALNNLISYSFKSFIKGLSIIFKYEKISKSPTFWLNLFIFLIIKNKYLSSFLWFLKRKNKSLLHQV